MSDEKLYLNAYYYSFEPTGVIEIDRILEAVAMAGKAYHNTDGWRNTSYEEGKTYVDLIQDRAKEAAERLKS